MDRDKKLRAVIRSQFTKTVDVIKAEIITEEVNVGLLKDKLAKLEDLELKLKDLNQKIIDHLLDAEVDEEVLTIECESTEQYSDTFISYKRQIRELIDSINSDAQSVVNVSSSNSVESKCYKLPTYEIRKFDGQLINWLPFWSQFKKIHEDIALHEADKFQYLVQSMEINTRARELVESYPQTTENYVKVVQALQQRFGKKDLLIEVYVRELLKLMVANVKASPKDKLPVSKLYDKIVAHLRALESMEINADVNAAWLYPMVESCLPEEVLKAWQRSSLLDTSQDSSLNSRLSYLLEFLRKEVEGEERRLLARKGFEESAPMEQLRCKIKQKGVNVPTAAGLFSTKDNKCLFCEKLHDSRDCVIAQAMSFKEKMSRIHEKKCCLRCLKYGHIAKFCRLKVKCNLCSKGHYILMCPELPCNKEAEKNQKIEMVQSTSVRQECTREVALMTLMVNIIGDNGTKKVRALLDSGSQKSYILESTVSELGFQSFGTVSLAHSLFGGAQTEAGDHKKYKVKLCSASTYSHSSMEFEFLDQKIICGSIPRIPKGPLLKELKRNKIWVSDIGEGCPKIELLIGIDIYGKLLTGRVKQLHSGLTAVETKLGWTVCGHSPQPDVNNISPSLVASMAMHEMPACEFWKLETIGIKDPNVGFTKSEEEVAAQQYFLGTVCRNEEGRYCVSLPWLEKQQDIPSNYNIAERRFFGTTQRLKNMSMFHEYDQVIQEWLKEGIVEEVPQEDLGNKSHYLPHHPVVKPESSTTKIRPVFDASCKNKRYPSLNDCLIKGPNLLEQIPAILLKFREKAIGVIADIRKAFLQIELKQEDRDYLRFLWWKGNEQVQVLRHTRVVFGVNCSPFLLAAVIFYHLSKVTEDLKPLAQKLSKSFYVDNCVTSVESDSELRDFIVKSTEIFAEAKMDLRMWQFGPMKESENVFIQFPSHVNVIKESKAQVLGLEWDLIEDTLNVNHPKFELLTDLLSKRDILSITQKVFDPIGFLAPVLIVAKLLIQQAWAIKSKWDDPLPPIIQEKFLKWYKELSVISDLNIPRRVGFGNKKNWSIHAFCDASQIAYATAIFLRCIVEDSVSVQLLCAKSRLCPLKKITIPRLELLACTLGSRLVSYIIKTMNLEDVPIYYWSDSTTALSWIKRNDQWGTFVGNRVKEICTISNPNQWFYVPGNFNPADLPSRGCDACHLKDTRWWEGPVWLKLTPQGWPSQQIYPDENLIYSERRKTILNCINVKTESPKWYERFSKFSKIVRVCARILRFIKAAQKKTIFVQNTLDATEIEEAEKVIWKCVQQEVFSSTGDSINGLMVIRDEFGLIRLKTKIIERKDTFSFRYPVLLPSNHHVITCLIREFHLKHCHAGIQVLSTSLRENYWILKSRRRIRSIISKCVKCKRFSAKAVKTVPVHLPLDRVRDASAFEISGIDLAGPLYLKNKSKAWIVLFTCAVYRAVHLELVSSLSTENFIQALRRFIARRGRPSTIYSDNGTNFIGTRNALRNINWSEIICDESVVRIKWKFIPPTAAWWGGWWERLIRIIKGLLVRVLGHSSVNYEEMSTILCDVEAIVNNRPLTYISEDSEDLIPLCPSMFIQDIKEVGVPDLDHLDTKKYLARYRYCQKLRDELRSRFRREYLGQLVQKTNQKTQNLRVGDIVLIEMENKKRIHWPLAKIIELFPGRDGCSRVAKVKTKSGILIRPFQRLYPLEVSSTEESVFKIKKNSIQKSDRESIPVC